MLSYLLSSKPMYLWIALALPVFSSLFLISKINDFAVHFEVATEIPVSSRVQYIDPNGL